MMGDGFAIVAMVSLAGPFCRGHCIGYLLRGVRLCRVEPMELIRLNMR